MSQKEELKSFKAGEKQRPGVEQPKAAKRTREQEQLHQEASLGFDRIERILEDEDPSEVISSLQALHESLAEVSDHATTPREKSEAGKALAAVERTSDLLNYLFEVKAAMTEPE